MEANTNVLFRRLHRPSEGRIRRTSGGSLDLDDDVTVNSAPFALFAAVHFFFRIFVFKKNSLRQDSATWTATPASIP